MSMVPSSFSSADVSPDISSPSSDPFRRKNTLVREYFNLTACSEGTEVAANLEIGRFNQIEVVAIPQVRLDDPPAADQLAVSPSHHAT